VVPSHLQTLQLLHILQQLEALFRLLKTILNVVTFFFFFYREEGDPAKPLALEVIWSSMAGREQEALIPVGRGTMC